MSDLLVATVIFGTALLIVVLACLAVLAKEWHGARTIRRHQQALASEQKLREIENAPMFPIDPIIDSLPADIRKDFQQ